MQNIVSVKRNASRVIFAALLLIVLAMVAILLYSILGSSEDEDEETGDALDLRTDLIEPPLAIDDFSLPATTGEDYSLSGHDGKVRLLYFGYMSCPDFCPTTMAELQRVFAALSPEQTENVEVLFITVDPERDDLERLGAFVSAFDERFIGLRTDDASYLQGVMSQFGVVAVKREVDSAMGYLMDHTASVFMLNPAGELIARFAYGTPVDDLTHDIQAVLNHKDMG